MAFKNLFTKEHLYMLACCTSLFLIGWNDGSTGPLIPRMQDSYNVDYIVVSMIFVCNCLGCMLAAALNMWISDKYGFGWTVTAGSLFQGIALAIETTRPPFPVMAFSYFIGGVGLAFQIAQNNAFIAMLPNNPHAKMMIAHGCYGFGAFVAPLVSTQFAKQKHWNFHYLTSLALSMVNTASLALIFRFRAQADILRTLGVQDDAKSNQSASQGAQKYFELMRLRIVHIVALFIFVYVGTEVTLGAWSVSFLIHDRNGGSSSGYVSSGFFGGLALGRFALIWLNKLVGPTRVVYLYGTICIGLELTVWLLPNLIENAFAISFVGFFMGPMYPTVVMILSNIVPPRFFGGAIGWIACTGSTGAAIFPFILALMAQRLGVAVLQPLLVGLLALMLALWTLALYYKPAPWSENEQTPEVPVADAVLDLQELPGRPRLPEGEIQLSYASEKTTTSEGEKV